MMNRRNFFRRAAIGAAVVAVTPGILAEVMAPPPVATIGEYYNYVNFSSVAVAADFDAMITDCAIELGYREGAAIDALNEMVFE
jgi:hypothetical protein